MIQALPPAIVAGEVVRLQTRQHVVALTFDGGGNADAAKRVLAILKRDRVPGTFFLRGISSRRIRSCRARSAGVIRSRTTPSTTST